MELSFKNDPLIKSALIKRMDDHIAADELLQKATGDNGKGCTVWCALNNGDMKHGYTHSAFPDVLGLPEWLAQLQDTIFEELNAEDAKAFSSAWPKSIPVGKNLEPVKWKFCAFIMKQNIERVLLLDIADDLKKQVVDAINGVLKLHIDAVETGQWSAWSAASAESAARSAWSAASAARSAAASAESAAWSAWSAASAASAESAASAASAESAAWSAWSAESAASAASAESAAWSAWSAASAARSAAESAARSAARSAAYKLYAYELINLLKNA